MREFNYNNTTFFWLDV